MLLVALLVSLCMPTVLRAGVIVEGETDGKVYYIRNVATGLYLKYGGSWNDHAVEGRAAHPFVLESAGNGVYAISSIMGYMSSILSGNIGFSLSAAKGESSWELIKVDGENDYYYLHSGGNRYLASMSNPATGQLALKVLDANDDRQKWQFLTEDDIKSSLSSASGESIDLTPLVKASSFDIIDGLFPEDKKQPLYSTYKAKANRDNWVVKYTNRDEDYEVEGIWHYGVAWNLLKEIRGADPTKYNYSMVLRNNTYAAFTLSQTIKGLPQGNYTLSFEGFYARCTAYRSETMNVTLSVKESATSLGSASLALNNDVQGRDYNKFISAETEFHDVYWGDDYTSYYTSDGEVYTSEAAYKNANNAYLKQEYVAVQFRDNDTYLNHINFTVNGEGQHDITIELSKPATSRSYGGSNWQNLIACDNFVLTYHGTSTTGDSHKLYYEKVKVAYDAAEAKVDALDDTGLTCAHSDAWTNTLKVTLDATNKIAKLNGISIDTEEEYLDALANIEAAYQAALAAHKQAIMDKTHDDDEVPDVPFILNHSFETGDLTGWTVGSTGAQIAVFPNANGTYKTEDTDGNYLFNSYVGDENTFTPWIKQEITGLKNGLYKLQALLTSFEGNHVYLIGNNYHDYIVADGKTTFKEATLYFLVENGTATIGAIGGHHRMHNRTHEPVNGKHLFDCYWPDGGCFFKADNFRLTYICDVPNGKLRLALNEASNAKLDEYGQASIASTITEYENKYLEREATDGENGNVGDYVTAIHTALNTAAKAQKTIGADMTYAIKNPNFEWDWVDGEWVCETGGDTGIKEQDHWNYKTAGVDGRFLFNTWNGDTGAKPLTQTVAGLPNGTYKVRAMVTSVAGDDMVILTANNCSTSVKTYAGSTGEYVEVECKVTGDNGVGNLDIKVEGKSVGETGWWFKADDFHLTLVLPSDELVLNQDYEELPEINGTYKSVTVKRSITAGNWSTFVVPFQIPEEKITELKWDVRELVSSRADETGEDNKRNITLTFKKVSAIEAGVPYMIMVPEENENVTEFVVSGSVAVNTTAYKHAKIEGPDATEVDDVKFIGTYTKSVVPGNGKCYIVSKNMYKRVPETYTNGKEIKGFRAYIELLDKTGVARSMSYRWGEGETAIDSANNDELTIVAIYNLNGVRLDDMQEGINILRMSDGSTMKVIIK